MEGGASQEGLGSQEETSELSPQGWEQDDNSQCGSDLRVGLQKVRLERGREEVMSVSMSVGCV